MHLCFRKFKRHWPVLKINFENTSFIPYEQLYGLHTNDRTTEMRIHNVKRFRVRSKTVNAKQTEIFDFFKT